MRARLQMRGSVIAYVVNGGLSTTRATANVDRLIAEVRGAVFREAADFMRDAHFRDGMSVQEIGVALRCMAAAARPDDTTGA